MALSRQQKLRIKTNSWRRWIKSLMPAEERKQDPKETVEFIKEQLHNILHSSPRGGMRYPDKHSFNQHQLNERIQKRLQTEEWERNGRRPNVTFVDIDVNSMYLYPPLDPTTKIIPFTEKQE